MGSCGVYHHSQPSRRSCYGLAADRLGLGADGCRDARNHDPIRGGVGGVDRGILAYANRGLLAGDSAAGQRYRPSCRHDDQDLWHPPRSAACRPSSSARALRYEGSYLMSRGLVPIVTRARIRRHEPAHATSTPIEVPSSFPKVLSSCPKVPSSSPKVPSSCLEVLSTMLETIAVGVMLVRVVGTMPRREAKNFSRFRDFSSAVWEESCIFAR